MLPRLLERVRAALVRCPADCGQHDPPHAYREVSFADGQISPDQARIAEALPPLLSPRTRLLHVGVGCSDLAIRFAKAIEHIDGITVMADEQAAAERCGLANYRVWKLNKYAPAFADLPGPYHLIVDNNPGSYACCRRHFRSTMAQYSRLLTPGGRLVTEQRGALWQQPGGLSLRWRDWARLGGSLGLEPEQLTETVWALRKPGHTAD